MESDVINIRGDSPGTPHDLIVNFLLRECGVSEADYDALYVRVIEWASVQSAKVAVNEFNPIMLLEQCRREFDVSVDLATFALIAADLQWGPRMIKIADFEKPVWVIALQGFPTLIAEAQRLMGQTNAD